MATEHNYFVNLQHTKRQQTSPAQIKWIAWEISRLRPENSVALIRLASATVTQTMPTDTRMELLVLS